MRLSAPLSPPASPASHIAAAAPKRQPRWTALAALLLAGPFAGAAQAATITVTTTDTISSEACALTDAVIAANTDTATGGCPAGSGADTLVLPKDATFTLSTAAEPVVGNGLPTITAPLTIIGNGSTIARSADPGTPQFRFFEVATSGFFRNSLTLESLTLRGGSVTNDGGAIFGTFNTDITVRRCTLSGNSSNLGGAVYVADGSLTVTDSQFIENQSKSSGGAVTIDNGSVGTILRSRFTGNTASQSGGGLYAGQTPTTIVTVDQSSFSGNRALQGGGGIYSIATVTLNNSTLIGNRAEVRGGGFWGLGTIVNSTITANTAGNGGGVAVDNGNLTLRNSVVAGNSATGTVAEALGRVGARPTRQLLIANANNLFGHAGVSDAQAFTGGFLPGASDLKATSDALNLPLGNIVELGADSLPVLKDNGGVTPTVALAAGSPAVNAADPLFTDSTPTAGTSLRLDQRGRGLNTLDNPPDTRRDIGAFELGGIGAPAAPTGLSTTTSGVQVTVRFTPPSDDGGKPITGYKYSTDDGASFTEASPASTGSPIVIGGLNAGSSYQIRILAVNVVGDGTPSDAASVTLAAPGACGSANDMDTATAPVENLCTTGTATAVTGSNDAWRWSCTGSGSGSTTTCAASYAMPTITLKASPTSITVGGDGSTVFASSTSGLKPQLLSFTSSVCSVNPTAGDPAGTTVTATGIAAGTCTVFATLAGTGDAGVFRYRTADDESVDITVAKGAQTITGFAAGKTTLKVGEMTTLSATGGASGNEVSFKSLSSEICFVSGAMVTALSAGTCTVAADQAGNDGYNAATQATIDITVAKAAQLISGFTAHPASLKVGGMATLSASGGASGNSISFRSSTSEVCSVSGAMVTALSAGTCTVIASQAGNADFEAADEVSLNVPVAKAAQLISGFTANPSTIKVGQTGQLSAFGGASGKPILFASTTADTCNISGSTVTALAVGTCTVTASQTGNADFEAAETAMLNIGIEAAEVVTAPALALDMNDLDFGTGYLLRFRDIGVETTSEAEVVTLSNSGTAPLAISSIVTTGDFRHTTTCGATVAPGATCTISIRFSPKAVGTRTGETRITSNAVTSPDLIRLSGTGKGLQPAIKTNVSSFNFGRVKVGAVSRDQTLVITSTGSGPLEIRNITVTGDYTGSHNCPRFLDAGKSCQVTGRFRPKANGVRPGAVSILTSVSSTPTQVTLTGTGTSGGTVN